MAGRRYEDDEYLSMRYPGLFGMDDYYSEVYPDDNLDSRGFRRPTIGPTVKRTPATIGPVKRPMRDMPVQDPWYERLGGYLGRGYPNTTLVEQLAPGQQRARPTPMGTATIGPVRKQPLGNRLPAGNYQDTNTPQRIVPPQVSTRDVPAPQYSGNPFVNATIAARANSTGAAGTPRQPSIYGEGLDKVPNALRIAMANARANSNRPGAPRPAPVAGPVNAFGAYGEDMPGGVRAAMNIATPRPGVFSAQGVTNPNSVVHRQNADYDIGFNPRAYPSATRVASAANRAIRPRGIPSDVPVGPPPGGMSAPPDSPVQQTVPSSPYGDTGWTRNAPNPFMGQEGPSAGGAWSKFNITDAPGRNAAAEGNFPGTQAGPPVGPYEAGMAARDPNDRGTQYNWTPTERYNKYLESEPDRSQFKPGGWSRLLNAASAGVHGYRTGDIGEGIALGRALNDRPYEQAVESWKRRGTGLARAVELEDKRYKIAVEDENRRADNFRQQQELDLRRQQHLLADKKFQHEIGMDNWKLMTEGWKPMQGANGTIVMHRMGANGPEEYDTGKPNTALTAAQTLAEGKATRDAAMARTQVSANAGIQSARIGAQSRASEGALNRAHQSSENLLERANRLDVKREGAGVTGGADYTSPVKLLQSPSYKALEQSGMIKLLPVPGTQGEYQVEYKFKDPKAVQAELERLSGGDPARFTELATRYREFEDYMVSLGGQ